MKTQPNNRGAAVITAVLFFVVISAVVALSLGPSTLREYKTTDNFTSSKSAYYLSESGLEDVMYRLKNAIPVGSVAQLSLNGNTATTTTTDVSSSEKTLLSVGDVLSNTRRVGATLSTGAGEDFNYAMQVGPWGLIMGANAIINGNVYSEGPICAGGTGIDWGLYATCTTIPNNPSWPTYTTSSITGTVVSTGATGSEGWIVRVVNSGGNSMYAGTITNSVISGGAYCNTNYMTTPSSCDTLPPLTVQPLPLSDEDIEVFKDAAAAGGSDPCNSWDHKTISTDATIGPLKYGCASLTFDGPTSGDPIIITLQGPIWSTGTITFKDRVNVRVDPTYVGQSIAIVVDEAQDNWWSRILLTDGDEVNFTGAAGGNSWIALITANNELSTSGDYSNPAIDVGTNVSGDVILYAKDGLVRLDTSSIAEINGYGVQLKNNANVTYQTGLANTLFHSGPSGSWETVDWKLGQ